MLQKMLAIEIEACGGPKRRKRSRAANIVRRRKCDGRRQPETAKNQPGAAVISELIFSFALFRRRRFPRCIQGSSQSGAALQ